MPGEIHDFLGLQFLISVRDGYDVPALAAIEKPATGLPRHFDVCFAR
jgi:hypothetical protein